MGRTDELKKAALQNRASVSAGMVLVGVVAAGSLARSKRRRAAASGTSAGAKVGRSGTA